MYDDIKDMLVATFKVPADEISPDSTLEELELDSLDVVELAAMIKDQLGVEVSDDEMAGLMRVGSIAGLVQSRATRV